MDNQNQNPEITSDAGINSGFEVWYIKNDTALTQTHATLHVSQTQLQLFGENNEELASIDPQSVQSIYQGLDSIVIQTADQSFRLMLSNRLVGGAKLAILGPVWGVGGKSGMASSDVQARTRELINLLTEFGYPITNIRPKMTKKQIIKLMVPIIVITLLVTFLVVVEIKRLPG